MLGLDILAGENESLKYFRLYLLCVLAHDKRSLLVLMEI